MASEVARTPPPIFKRINNKLGLTKAHYFDVTPLKPHFEKKNDYDAENQETPSDLAFNNFPWKRAQRHLERMMVGFLKKGKSYIIVCNDKTDEREYFKHWIEAFAEQMGLPLMAFGGYNKKLPHGVKIIYLLQPEWWDYLDHDKREKRGEEVPYVSDGWKSQKHIEREVDEAIEALYKLGINVRDISDIVGVGNPTVTSWIEANVQVGRKRPYQKKEHTAPQIVEMQKTLSEKRNPLKKRMRKMEKKEGQESGGKV